MKLSLCVITKNEEKFLDQCLDSVKSIVDEIIVVDSFSTDKTKEIAYNYGAKVFDFEWVNDFSKARNFSLEKATGNWILILDADETIAEKDLLKIQKLIQVSNVDAYSLIQRSYGDNLDHSDYVLKGSDDYIESKNFGGWIPSKLVRLFRNDSRYRFKYKIHELIEPSIIDSSGVIVDSDISIHHFVNRKDKKFLLEKSKGYIELGLKQLEETPNNVKAIIEVALGFMKIGKNLEAEKYFKKGLELNFSENLFYIGYSGLLLKQNRFDEVVMLLTDEVVKFNVVLLNNLAIAFIGKKDFKSALGCLKKALSLTKHNISTYNNLGAIFCATNNIEQATMSYETTLKINPNNLIALVNLGIIYVNQRNYYEAKGLLEKANVVDNKNVKVLFNLAIVYEKLKHKEKALFLLREALELDSKFNNAIKEKIKFLESH